MASHLLTTLARSPRLTSLRTRPAFRSPVTRDLSGSASVSGTSEIGLMVIAALGVFGVAMAVGGKLGRRRSS